MPHTLLTTHPRRNGFTLIEVTAVIGIVGVALPVLFATLFLIIQQQVRSLALIQTQREGVVLINRISDTLKEKAVTVHTTQGTDVCHMADPDIVHGPFVFKTADGADLAFEVVEIDDKKTMELNHQPLHSPKIEITHFALSCAKKNEAQNTIVTISFVVQPKNTRSGAYIAIPFARRVLLQRYTIR